MNYDEKEALKDRLEDYCFTRLTRSGKDFICPACHSGTGPNKTPAFSIARDKRQWRCFSCGKGGDLYDLIRVNENLSQADAFKRARELYGGGGGDPEKAKPAARAEKDFTGYFGNCRTAYQEDRRAKDYMTSRGISEATSERFRIGFDPEYKINREGKTAGCIIIPTGRSSFVARNTDPEAAPGERYRKAGAVHLFNGDALTAAQPVFVVEGEIDALSVIECGFEAVALGSVSNAQALYNRIKTQPPEQPLILLLDIDDPGVKAAKSIENEIHAKLARTSVLSATELLSGDLSRESENALRMRFRPLTSDFRKRFANCKDANEMLLKDREGLTFLLQELTAAAADEVEEDRKKAGEDFYLKYSAGAYLDAYLKEWQTNGIEAIPTGFAGLDDALDGGLYEGLNIIGGASSVGKTAFALQIATHIAEGGRDVIIFSLEMSRAELAARIMSRHTAELADQLRYDPSVKKTTHEIMTGKFYEKYSDDEKNIIAGAATKLSLYADHLFIVEGIGNIGVETIENTVKEYTECHEAAPLVVVDYLQLLIPDRDRMTDKQAVDYNVMRLKQISRDHKIPLIALSSFNRAATGAGGKVSEENFKESGAIEYSSDVLIGLNYKAAEDGDGAGKDTVRDAGKAPIRDLQAVIIKNRNGQRDAHINFKYYALFNQFKEV